MQVPHKGQLVTASPKQQVHQRSRPGTNQCQTSRWASLDPQVSLCKLQLAPVIYSRNGHS